MKMVSENTSEREMWCCASVPFFSPGDPFATEIEWLVHAEQNKVVDILSHTCLIAPSEALVGNDDKSSGFVWGLTAIP